MGGRRRVKVLELLRPKQPMDAVVLTMPEMAAVIGWDLRKTRRWLVSRGAAVKRGGRYITTPQLLAQNFPEVAAALMREVDVPGAS